MGSRMRVATWNVNSLRVRLPHVLRWLETTAPDVLGLQETKLPDDAFPEAALREAGYASVFSGQKTYNGVALLTRETPRDVVTSLDGLEDPQRRIVAATVGGIRIYNVYVPNGQAVGTDKYAYKLVWLAALREQLARELQHHPRLLVIGDFNIAPDDRDVHDPAAWEGQVLVSAPEREALQALISLGLGDCFRLFPQEEERFSWWDYRAAAFRRNRGLRIDLLLASTTLSECCKRSEIDTEPRGWERPSDHAPAFADFCAD
jgi:exodeoxyribonuclease-3